MAAKGRAIGIGAQMHQTVDVHMHQTLRLHWRNILKGRPLGLEDRT